MIIVLRIANPYIILRQITNLPQLRTSAAKGIQEQTEQQGSAFFFKQWGTWDADGIKRNKHKNGKLINGKVFQTMPNMN